MKSTLIRVTSSYFVAGAIINGDGIIIHAAPIIKWSIGKHYSCLKKYKVELL